MDTKRIVIVSIVVILALPLLARLGRKENAVPAHSNEGQDSETVKEPVEPSKPPDQQEPTPPSIMTRAQFNQIRPGMSYEECVRIVGAPGTPVDSAECRARGMTAAYTWLDPQGAVQFELGFRAGRLAAMGFGLPPAVQKERAAAIHAAEAKATPLTEAEVRRLELAAQERGLPVVVTIAEFDRIKLGMTYDECVAIIGQHNPMAAQYAGPRAAALTGSGHDLNTLTEAYKWPNPGGYYAEISFANGRVTHKVWKKGEAAAGGSARGSSSRQFVP